MTFRIRAVAALFLLAMPVLASAAEGKLNMLCSANLEWCELMKARYEKEFNVPVAMVRKSAGETFAQIRAEAANPKADIWWAGSGDPHVEAAKLGLTEQYKSSRMNELHPWGIKQAVLSYYRTIGIYMGVLAVGYNEKVLKAKKLPAPKCWKDLANPAYRDEIQMANPNSSGTAYNALASFVQIMGEEEAFKFMVALHKNISQYPKAGAAPAEAASRGETAIAIAFAHDLTKQAAKGFPLKIVVPCEGTGYEVGSMSIIKGARNMEQAKHFYDWALRADVQGWGPEANEWATPANKSAKIPAQSLRPEKVKLISYDQGKYGSAEVRKHLLKRWTDEIFAQSR